MRKLYQKQKWLPRSKADARTEKAPVTQQLTNHVMRARPWALGILVSLGLVLFIIEVRSPEIILEPIEVPEDIAKLGYTGTVVAEQLVDAAQDIKQETQDLAINHSWYKDAMNSQEVGTNARIQDISVPGSTSSLRSIVRFIRQELGLHADYLRGEIVHENIGLRLTLRNLSYSNVPPHRIYKKKLNNYFKMAVPHYYNSQLLPRWL